MEETKDQKSGYKVFRITIYVSLLLEFFMYAIPVGMLDSMGGIVENIH